jgi:hypothetical protein
MQLRRLLPKSEVGGKEETGSLMNELPHHHHSSKKLPQNSVSTEYEDPPQTPTPSMIHLPSSSSSSLIAALLPRPGYGHPQQARWLHRQAGCIINFEELSRMTVYMIVVCMYVCM